ncbi:hypothetical protein BOTBODRAFT_118738 [Botryobasidium botryosum FD-172 SS1]|uniref:CxC1-like cysteine cluster associated with KDZ transposases domain-containing protein n=1 Tax=Botryobasidium botryosum (strain FD-172 SS1) TaxID=930990 RepID=A0A067M162_BOTB1|nr:hypothetical protein BOTBODRAFT_118738 [Botryobasidium botryosum FD-172 SS1]
MLAKQRGDQSSKASKKKEPELSGLPISNSVLDTCNSTFISAQENVAKASKKFYSDTGLMALLCRHNRVLWLVNLTTPGERQHYILALIVQLFRHLPPFWLVGLLYDIACQLHRSLIKWGLLPEYASRLKVAVSMFHAYGHEWPCQLVYHPRKCIGFGLTDGEGCERFWSTTMPLIPSLRVSGFHCRLFILDCQLIHLEGKSMTRLGIWLARRICSCRKRLADAIAKINECGVPVDTLCSEWQAQVKAQTEKSPRQSKNIADKAVTEVISERLKLKHLGLDVAELKDRQAALSSGETEKFEAIGLQLQSTGDALALLTARVKTMEKALGVTGKQQLDALKGNPYLRARMNARALRTRIRARIVEHKFERTKLERAYRRQIAQEKNHAHTAASIHRRQNGISSLINKFNKLADEMMALRRDGKAPPKTHPPRKLNAKKIFRLDVDDELWQEDPGLGDDTTNNMPGWLGNDKVRDGITAMLERDRCLEEEQRLRHEQHSMQEWIAGEFNTLTAACLHHQGLSGFFV